MPPLRAISSVGSEHLVYTEGVGSSSLSSPTTKAKRSLYTLCRGFFNALNRHKLAYVRGDALKKKLSLAQRVKGFFVAFVMKAPPDVHRAQPQPLEASEVVSSLTIHLECHKWGFFSSNVTI